MVEDSTGEALHPVVRAALSAYQRGYQPVPIRGRTKSPHVSAWPHLRWQGPEEVAEKFEQWVAEGATNVGLVLGKTSGGLIDVDLDHPKALRLAGYFLPPTPMRTGRASSPMSHYWYRAADLDAIPGTRRHKMPDRSVSVELRTDGSQTLIPPSIHESGEKYRWEGARWGGRAGPAVVDGRKLALQVALLGMGCVLLEHWPSEGGRHDAYLALAGGLLRMGSEGGVHPYWERNLPPLIRAMASATHDETDDREQEVMRTTLAKLRTGERAVGFPRLGEIVGMDHAELVRRMAREVESLAGYVGNVTSSSAVPAPEAAARDLIRPSALDPEALVSTLPPEERDPLSERVGTWQPVDLEPYLAGEIRVPEPTILRRSDGVGLFYQGRVNVLYGQSESAKSWIALAACQQEMALGERVMYLDFEDEPTFTLVRLNELGVGDDDVRALFTYVHPEDPHQDMQRNRFGTATVTDIGRTNADLLAAALQARDPSLIVVDGMTALYGLHGLDTNDAASTDIITTWLKRLCRNGRSTVIVIDHTGKGAVRGSSPIGAHHKIAMAQGTALQAHPINRPMPGVVGMVELLIHKDRPGQVRSRSPRKEPAVAAVVTFDSTEPGRVLVTIDPVDGKDVVLGSDMTEAEAEEALAKAAAKLAKEQERREAAERAEAERAEKEQARQEARREWDALLGAVLDTFSGDPSVLLGKSEIAAGLAVTDVPDRTLRMALSALVEDGALVQSGERRWTKYGLSGD